MKKILSICALIACNSYAVDTYNASNGQLTIPSVNVGTSVYNNVVVTVGSVLSVGATSVPNQSAEGLWTGVSTNGFQINLLALENNEFWTIAGLQSGNTFTVYAFTNGGIVVTGANGYTYYKQYNPNYSTVLGYGVGTIVANTSLVGTTYTGSEPASKVTFTPLPNSNYNYNKSADISEIVGSWSGTFLNGYASNVSISSSGNIIGTVATCSYTGTLKARASGKNVFDFTITNGAGCSVNGLVQSGIAITYITNTGKRQLLAAGIDSTKTLGDMFFAQR